MPDLIRGFFLRRSFAFSEVSCFTSHLRTNIFKFLSLSLFSCVLIVIDETLSHNVQRKSTATVNYFALLSRTTYDYLERTFIGIKLKRFRNKLLRFQVGKRQKRNIKCWSTLVDIQINGKLFWEFHPDNLKNNPNEILTNVDGYLIINPGG